MEPFDASVVRAAYDAVAADYADAFGDDLLRLPLDREVLDDFARRMTRRGGPVLEVGCGPAQVSQYLANKSLRVVATDLSPEMLRVARQRTGITCLACADMRSLPFGVGSFAGIVAFYSIHHLPRTALRSVLAEINRILEPGGTLVVATHLGESEAYTSAFLGHEFATVGGTLYRDTELLQALRRQSFLIEHVRYRDPLGHEHDSQRIYVTAVLPRG
jgi:ubiquinone/menaquinone biosynthesis C-methylase UbiE